MWDCMYGDIFSLNAHSVGDKRNICKLAHKLDEM